MRSIGIKGMKIVEFPIEGLPYGYKAYFDQKDQGYFFVTNKGEESKKFYDPNEFMKILKLFVKRREHERSEAKFGGSPSFSRRLGHERAERLAQHELGSAGPVPKNWEFAKRNPRRKKAKTQSKIIKGRNAKGRKKNPDEKWEIEELFYTIDRQVDRYLMWNLKYDSFPSKREIAVWFRKNYFLTRGQKIVEDLFYSAMGKRAASYWNISGIQKNFEDERYDLAKKAYWELAKSYGITIGRYTELFDKKGRHIMDRD